MSLNSQMRTAATLLPPRLTAYGTYLGVLADRQNNIALVDEPITRELLEWPTDTLLYMGHEGLGNLNVFTLDDKGHVEGGVFGRREASDGVATPRRARRKGRHGL